MEEIWAKGIGAYKHSALTRKRIAEMFSAISKSTKIKKHDFYHLLIAADKITSFAMWLTASQVYAKNIYTDGRALQMDDFKKDPQGHLGGALNMIPAYVGYMLSNALTGITRAWVMEQGHAVSGIDAVNLILNNMSKAHSERYSLTDRGLTEFSRDFYSYKINKNGKQDSPLGSHVNPNTAGGHLEGGYLGFASLQYVHMPLPGEHLVAFLSDGAFEEQKGADWTGKWWRAEDSGLIAPIMIANGRRIDQRATITQEGGADWFSDYLKVHGFEPIIFDGRDPAAFAWSIWQQEISLQENAAKVKNIDNYRVKIPYGIAVAPKGAGFYNEGTNFAHNLPLVQNPRNDETAFMRFNENAKKLYIPIKEVKEAAKLLNNHTKTKRKKERDNPIANRNVELKKLPSLTEKELDGNRYELGALPHESPMDAIDLGFVKIVKSNPKLRPRVGNPDEMLSNKMDDTLAELKFRVNEAEGGQMESTLGKVITVLNEEAVAGAAFGNKGGINIIVSYEAFAAKMFGEARQEIIFSKHKKELGQKTGWLSVPIILTSNTWENGKNELSHQDPSFAESMLSESSDISRVLFPADYNSAAAVISEVYKTQGQIWTVIASKKSTPVLFSKKESSELLKNGAINLDFASFDKARAKLCLIAIGSYQLLETIRASKILHENKIPHISIYIIEPGRFRKERNNGEKKHIAKESFINEIMPKRIENIVMSCHTRPELIAGTMQNLLYGKKISALGFINEGGTLDTEGMLFVNQCTYAHIVKEAAQMLHIKPSKILTETQIKALDCKISPDGVLF